MNKFKKYVMLLINEVKKLTWVNIAMILLLIVNIVFSYKAFINAEEASYSAQDASSDARDAASNSREAASDASDAASDASDAARYAKNCT